MSVQGGSSYWAIVGRQLAKNGPAMFGYRCIVGLFLVAVYTPAIALDQPFYFRDGEKSSWPWFTALFDMFYVRQGVDLFFNLLIPFLPLTAAAFLLLRRLLRARGRWSGKAARRTLLAATLLFLWTFAGLYIPDAKAQEPAWRWALAPGTLLRPSPTREKIPDYHEREAEALKAGRDVHSVFPPLPYSYHMTRIYEGSLPPDWFQGKVRKELGAVAGHPLGTDPGGKDVLTSLLYGTRISMTIGVIAVGIYVTIGIILGALAGYFGGWVDMVISRLTEMMICFPTLFFVLTIISVIGSPSIFLIMAAIGFTGWTGVTRLVRGEFLTQRGLDYSVAADALGIPRRRIIFRHVLPNALTPVLVAATFGVAGAILTESSISFLGLGDPNAASWGMLLNTGRMTNFDWLILAPGASIFLTVTVFNLLGEGLRDALDPKLRR
ncbi:MAG: ABC transporter permease [Planctomycetaceae bacterium]